MDTPLFNKLEFDKVLNLAAKYCSTENAVEYIKNLRPKTKVDEIIYEGGLVTEAKNLLIQDNNLPIEYLPDLNETISRSSVEGSIITEKKLLQLLRFLVISRLLFNYIKINTELASELSNLSKHLFVDKLFESHITKILKENGEIKDSASVELKNIRDKIKDK